MHRAHGGSAGLRLEIKEPADEDENDHDDNHEDESEEEELLEEEQIESLKKYVDELEKKNNENVDKMKRLQADFENYKKRCTKEKEEIISLATERLVIELLLILDDFERALANSKDNDEETSRKGLEMMHKNLKEVLKRQGVSEISTKCTLDPFQHEVVSKVDDESREDSEIVECLQKGYRMGSKVIRPARVIVCRKEKKNEYDENQDNSTE
ncbi:MAG: nucleotide exchange factor GrpE [Thermoplasmata archaeon]|nr:nucleotide exchange factor GrpE [Thermoplasmata archaeon]